AAEQSELIHHWDPVSRGVEVEQQTGWYFTGRDKLLQEISDWLNDPTDCQTRIITGKAGAGKSAILSRIVTISDPEYRRKVPSSDRRWTHSFPIQSIDIAIHAKGKTLDEVITRIAKHLNINLTRSAIIDNLQGRPNPLRIVIDALDEALEPDRIARELLEPLNSFHNVKLLVGTRPTYLEALGSNAVVIYVDTPNYLEKKDFEDYIEARLLAQGDPQAQTPYYQEEELAIQLAKAVAEKAYPNFLIGRLFAEYLISLPKPVDLETLQQIGVPSTIDQAFEQYLNSFKENKQKVRDLLLPLAWAEGLGLPWNTIWAPLAFKLSTRAYSDEDIDWVLRHAGSFIIETLEKGRSVYRLYHQALADYLRQGFERTHVQRLIVQTLISTVPPFEDGTGTDWRLAHSYVRLHLAEHAVACGLLNELMNDPLYLLTADSNRLVSAINLSFNEIHSDISQVYRKVIHHIRERPITEAASYLMLSAKKYDLTSLVNHPSLPHLHIPWEVPWLHWQSETPSQLIANGVNKINKLVAATWSNRPVVVLGRTNGTVEVWDISDSIQLINWQPDNVGFGWHLAFDQTSDGPLLLAAWHNGKGDNFLGVYNCVTGKSSILPLTWGKETDVYALCLTVRSGKAVCVTAHKDLTLIIWEVPSLAIVTQRRNATISKIYCLLPITLAGTTVLLSGGDHLGENNRNNTIMQLWSLDDLTPIWKDKEREKGIICYAESGMFFGEQLVVVSQNSWGPPEVWDFASQHRLFRDKDGTSTERSWLYTYMNNVYLIGVRSNQLVFQKVSYVDKKDGPILINELINESSPVEGDYFSNITQRYGRAVLLSAKGNYIHIWDIEELINHDVNTKKNEKLDLLAVLSIASGSIEKEQLFVASNRDVFVINAKTGSILSKTSLDVKGRIATMKYLPKQNKLLVGTSDGYLCAINLELSDQSYYVIAKDNSIGTICATNWHDRIFVFATVNRPFSYRDSWAVRIWDLSSGVEIDTDAQFNENGIYGLSSGEEDKQMLGLVITQTQSGIKLAFS
ncbi:NACHT domain-containing protein, partial [Nostoc sp. CHAB 5834]|nr:NACHT domain-containing protein [Nostoc sp. CHAB 5834]